MDAEAWILLAGVVAPIVGGLLAWLIYIERRMMTRDEHERLCKAARDSTAEKLDQVLDQLTDARNSHDRVATAVQELSRTVAVLADRAGVQR